MADPIYDTQNLSTGTHALLTIINRNAETGSIDPVSCDAVPLYREDGSSNKDEIREAMLYQHLCVTHLLEHETNATDG